MRHVKLIGTKISDSQSKFYILSYKKLFDSDDKKGRYAVISIGHHKAVHSLLPKHIIKTSKFSCMC